MKLVQASLLNFQSCTSQIYSHESEAVLEEVFYWISPEWGTQRTSKLTILLFLGLVPVVLSP